MRAKVLQMTMMMVCTAAWPARAAPPKSEFHFGGVALGQPIIRVARLPASPEADQRLQAALDLQADATTTADRQHDAWCAFAAMRRDNSYLADATTACKRWNRYMQQREHVRAAFTKDFRTVQRDYARADMDKARKRRMVDAFLGAYVAIDDDAAFVLARQWLQPTAPVTAKKEAQVTAFSDDDQFATATGAADGNPDVARVIARKNAAVQQCFDRALQDNPNENAHVKVRVTVGTDAQVTDVIVLGVPARFAECIRTKLLAIHGLPLLPKPESLDQSYVFSRN